MKYIKNKSLAFVLASCLSATATLPSGYEEFKGLKKDDCRDNRWFDQIKGVFVCSNYFSYYPSVKTSSEKYSSWLYEKFEKYSTFQSMVTEASYAQVHNWDEDSVLKVAVLEALRSSKGAEHVDAIIQKYSYDSKVIEELKAQVKEAGLEFSEEELNSKRLFNQAVFLQKLLSDYNKANLESENQYLKSALDKFSKSSEKPGIGEFKFGLPSGYEQFKGLKTKDCIDIYGFNLSKGVFICEPLFGGRDTFMMFDRKSSDLRHRYTNWLVENYIYYSTFQSMVTEASYAQVHNWDEDSVLKVAVLEAFRSKGDDVDAIIQKHSDEFKAVEELKTQVKEAGLEFSEEELNSKNLFNQAVFLQSLLSDYNKANLESENQYLKSALDKFSKSSEKPGIGEFKFGLPSGYEQFKGLKVQDCLDVRGFDLDKGAFIFKSHVTGKSSFVLFDKKNNSLNRKYSNWLVENYIYYSTFQSMVTESSYAQVHNWDEDSVLKVAVLEALRSKGDDVDAIIQKHSDDFKVVEELKTQVKEAGLEFSEEELNSKNLFNQAVFLQSLLIGSNNANLEIENAQLVSKNANLENERKSLVRRLAKLDKDLETKEKMLNQEREDFKFTVEGLNFKSKRVNEELERVKEEFKFNEAELSKENAELVERLSQVQAEFVAETRRLEGINEELGVDVREAEEAFHVAFAQISAKVDDILKTLGKTDADLEGLNLNEKLMMLKSGAEDSHWVFA